MYRRVFIITLFLILGAASVLFLLSVKAQSQEPNETLVVPVTFFANIDLRLDKIIAKLESQASAATIQQKLDQILANQEQIKQELAVIKVRATR